MAQNYKNIKERSKIYIICLVLRYNFFHLNLKIYDKSDPQIGKKKSFFIGEITI